MSRGGRGASPSFSSPRTPSATEKKGEEPLAMRETATVLVLRSTVPLSPVGKKPPTAVGSCELLALRTQRSEASTRISDEPSVASLNRATKSVPSIVSA